MDLKYYIIPFTMIETPKISNPESGKSLAEAVDQISGLIAGDKLGAILGTANPEQREEFWSRDALAFPLFSDKITALRKTLVSVEYTKKQYPKPVTAIMGMNFLEVEDMGARTLLVDILWGRMIKSPGYMNYEMDSVAESRVMEKEMGGSEQIKKISFEKVVEALLIGKLKFSKQTDELEKVPLFSRKGNYLGVTLLREKTASSK
jgi:hypothetical protein